MINTERKDLVKGISVLCANRQDNLIIFQELYFNEYLKAVTKDSFGRKIEPKHFEKILNMFFIDDIRETLLQNIEEPLSDFLQDVIDEHPEYFEKISEVIQNTSVDRR